MINFNSKQGGSTMNTTPNPLTSTDVIKETSIPANINTDVLENFSDTSEEYVC